MAQIGLGTEEGTEDGTEEGTEDGTDPVLVANPIGNTPTAPSDV